MNRRFDPSNDIVHAPHPLLTHYYASEEERRGFVCQMFDSTASDYDRIERLLALGSGPWYRGHLVVREAVKLVGDPSLVLGVDPSIGMMANARLPIGVQLVGGRAEAIPFPSASFDFLSMGYALRHVGDLSAAFGEFHRILKPGGRLCLMEITKPERTWSQFLLKVYMRGVVPVLARVIGGSAETARLWRYYWDTVDACVSPGKVIHTLEAAGFTGVKRHVETRALAILAEYQAIKPG